MSIKVPSGYERISARMLPGVPCDCEHKNGCVYRDGHSICDDPRTNKGNSDAACHLTSNKNLLALLTLVELV